MTLRGIGIILISLSLSACSWFVTKHGTFHNRTKDYLYAKTIPPMVTPPNTKTKGIIAYYPVANAPAANSLKKPVSILPPDLRGKMKS